MLEHGGRLRAAAKQYSIPLNEWVDLSTGINPNGWLVPALDAAIWNRLPEEDDGLMEAAADYYGTAQLLAVAGSQAAIQLLPTLRKKSRVAIISPCYAEHEQAWRQAGHEVFMVTSDEVETGLDRFDVVVVINPNNPTGALHGAKRLLNWHQQLSQKGGWLVVDEAFMDSGAESVIQKQMLDGLIVLRSLGKFFGLAGVRVGFLAADKVLLTQAAERLGPWTVSGPSREVARCVLEDHNWQLKNYQSLLAESKRLIELLSGHGLSPHGGTVLFQQVESAQAGTIFEKLAQMGILTRLFKQPARVRFGLPKDALSWHRLEEALKLL
jgi:cobalamin biosynthetic protein CobC